MARGFYPPAIANESDDEDENGGMGNHTPMQHLPPLFLPLIAAALGAVAAGAGTSPGGSGAAATGISARRCLSCHDSAKRSGGVDLSSRASGLGVLEPRAPARNRLLRMVTQGKMPPTGRLSDGEIRTLSAWIAGGSPYPAEKLSVTATAREPLWSLQPIRRPAIPVTPFDRLARNPVDRFLFATLAQNGLKPSSPAAKRELLRRVTFDLTGLPPAPETLDAFLADASPDAYERVVDRLLASPGYGERWGRHWLDVVRFGESHGYEQNHVRPNAWPYRDYVIRALNRDLPFDRFLQEQLAGDVLAKGDPETEPATGFLVAGIHDTVGIQTVEATRQQRANDLDDMVCTTGEAFLGLTVGCARCHDHKFDPIPQADYYRLAAVFAGVRHAQRGLSSPAGAGSAPAAAVRAGDEAERALRGVTGELADLDAVARVGHLRVQGNPHPPRPAVNARRNVDDFSPVEARFVRFVIEATKDGGQPCLDELEVYGEDRGRNLALASAGARATASSLLPGYAIHQIAHLNDGRVGNEWSWISNEAGRGWVRIEFPEPRRISRVVWSRDQQERPQYTDRLPSAYRIEVSADGNNWHVVADGRDRAAVPESIPLTALQAALNPEQRARRAQLAAQQDRLRQQVAAVSPSRTAYIGQFTAPDPVYLLRRGDVMQRGEAVAPAGLSQIPGLPADLGVGETETTPEPQRRLALARWLTDARNPLTPRVLVNRIWHYHFGRGLVSTPSDFGRNGDRPSHPELLDWLAAGFSGGGGRRDAGVPGVAPGAAPFSLKALHRLLVTTYTYRQSSAATAAGMAKDSGNRLLWRMPLRRLEAEAVRDAVLQTSGKLDRRMGGPGFLLYRYRVVNVAIYEPLEEYGPETWRRSVYQQAARGIRDDLLGSFDCPESAQRIPRRESTTTPLQALSLLNGPFLQQQAHFFAERITRDAGSDPAAQVERAFRIAFGRPPSAAEREGAQRLVGGHGLPALARVLLNANEFLYY